jgi:STE24 endopeptidase
MALSRRFEREADRFAFNVMKTTQPLVRALKKMAKDNLSNLRPHPLYVRFNHSHPPLLERIMALEDMS